MDIRRLTPRDAHGRFREIAELHCRAIHHGALPLLGVPFMAHLYHGLAATAGCGAWLVRDGDRTVGFLVGCADLRRSFRDVLFRRGFLLAWAALPRLFSLDVLRRVGVLLAYPFRRRAAPAEGVAPGGELLAIALDESARGQGYGKALIGEFERFLLLECGVDSYQVTTNAEDPESNAFYQRLGHRKAGLQPHHPLTLQRYTKTLHPRREAA